MFQVQPDAVIEIVSAYDAPASLAAELYIGTPVRYQELVDELKKAAKNAVFDAKTAIEKNFPNGSIKIEVRKGRPAEVILDVAKE